MGNTRNTHRRNEHPYRTELGKPEGKRVIGTDVHGSGPIILKLASICMIQLHSFFLILVVIT